MKKETETTSKQQQELSDTTDKNSYLVEFVEIKGTPFTAVKENENWFVIMGKYKLRETFENKESAIEWSTIS